MVIHQHIHESEQPAFEAAGWKKAEPKCDEMVHMTRTIDEPGNRIMGAIANAIDEGSEIELVAVIDTRETKFIMRRHVAKAIIIELAKALAE